MEKLTKPQNLYIRRNRALTAAAAFAFLAFAVALAALLPLGLIKYPPEKDILIPLIIGSSVIIFISFCLGALNFRNLFFPFLLTADEKGVYNYSGYFISGLSTGKTYKASQKTLPGLTFWTTICLRLKFI